MDPDTLTRILSFQRELLLVSAAASAAFAVSSAALVILAVMMASAALVVIAVMVSALMSFTMMITISAGIHQVAPQVGRGCFVSVSGSACADLDPRIFQCVQSAAAQTAADQYLNVIPGKKPCQRAVADPVGTDHFA
jgi:hypothetical protein